MMFGLAILLPKFGNVPDFGGFNSVGVTHYKITFLK